MHVSASASTCVHSRVVASYMKSYIHAGAKRHSLLANAWKHVEITYKNRCTYHYEQWIFPVVVEKWQPTRVVWRRSQSAIFALRNLRSSCAIHARLVLMCSCNVVLLLVGPTATLRSTSEPQDVEIPMGGIFNMLCFCHRRDFFIVLYPSCSID